MGPLQWLLLAAIILAVAIILVSLLLRPEAKKTTYKTQRFFLGGQQRKLWLALQKAAGNEYMVLAKVPLTALVLSEGENPEMQAWLEKRWADYAVLDEKFLKPVAVVQFEGRENDPLWAQGKDPILHKVLSEARLPLLWLPSEHYQHVELLRHALLQLIALEGGRTPRTRTRAG